MDAKRRRLLPINSLLQQIALRVPNSSLCYRRKFKSNPNIDVSLQTLWPSNAANDRVQLREDGFAFLERLLPLSFGRLEVLL